MFFPGGISFREVMAAFITKFTARRIDGAAAGAGDIQFAAAFVAEFGSRRIIELAIRAVHVLAFPASPF
jgi:hypothetical protein